MCFGCRLGASWHWERLNCSRKWRRFDSDDDDDDDDDHVLWFCLAFHNHHHRLWWKGKYTETKIAIFSHTDMFHSHFFSQLKKLYLILIWKNQYLGDIRSAQIKRPSPIPCLDSWLWWILTILTKTITIYKSCYKTGENWQRQEAKQMQPMWLCVFLESQFKKTLENAQRRKVQ